MARLLVLNNYPLDTVWQEVREGKTPDHLLFGINHLAALGHKIELLPYEDTSALARLSQWLVRARFPVPMGDLSQQLKALRRLRSCDLVYAPCQTQTQLLGYFRRWGWIRRPIVALAHHPMDLGRMANLRRPLLRSSIQGHDAFPALSKPVADEINRLTAPVQKSCPLPWGPDKTYYPPSEYPGEGVICAGRTARDWVTLGQAATQANTRTLLICTIPSKCPEFDRFGKNVAVNLQPASGWMAYPELCRHYATARVHAIPLRATHSIAGLSSLVDAMGMGKPMVMTRLPLFDFDLEKWGVGRWVAPGDVQGWREALQWFDTHPEEATAMGKRARQIVDEGFNSMTFASQLNAIFLRHLDRQR